MHKLFNKDGNGAEELVEVIGIIGNDLTYSKWEPIIPIAIRELKSIVGREALEKISSYYEEPTEKNAGMDEVLRYTKQAVAFFAWLKIIPTLDAQHGTAGRSRRLGENEKGMTALQEYKDETNILNLAYEAVDALVEALDTGKYDWWVKSEPKKAIDKLLIKDKNTFDQYYRIGSHRLFLTLIPILREIQDGNIIPIITRLRYERLLEDDKDLTPVLMDAVRRPLALLTIKKAVERLPIEVLPDGIVQVQQVGTIKEKLRAEKEARKSVAESLQNDADRYLQNLQDLIALLDNPQEEVDLYIPSPSNQRKGITF